ncbi:MAG: peptidylprolyl isomerase [Lachnospiraceae bacterium]
MDNKVLAVVAGEEITEADLNDFLKNVPKEQQAYLSNPQVREQYLEQLIALRMFSKQGEEEKLEETDEFKEIMESARKDILAQMMIAKLLRGINVTDEEAKDYYDSNKRQFEKGETVRAKHILVKEEEKCNEILTAINNGEKEFEDAAKEFSTCPSGQKGGDLGEFGKGQMVPEFEKAAFSAEIGQVVGPVKTSFGYHLIRVEKKTEATETPFDEVKDSIKGRMLQQKQNDAYNVKVKELKEKYM